MKIKNINLLFGLILGGAMALMISNSVQATEYHNIRSIYPEHFCYTCVHPIWG